MKDKDFDEIGKRLHDLEADPPKDGWKKIAPALHGTREPGKVVWLRKNWWKPLILLIPVSFYLLYSGQRGKQIDLASSLTADSSLQREAQTENEHAIQNTETSESIDKSVGKSKERTISDNADEQNLVRKEELSVEKSTNLSHPKRVASEPLTTSTLIENSPEGKTKIQHEGSVSTGDVTMSESEVIGNQAANGEQKAETGRAVGRVSSSDISGEAGRPSAAFVIVDATGPAVIDGNKDAVGTINGNDKSTVDQSVPVGKYEASNPSALALVAAPQLDTASINKSSASVIKDEQAVAVETTSSGSEGEEKKKASGQWRVTALFAPQFSTQSPTPVADDEVLVTEIEHSKYPEIIGFQFGIGAGRAIARNFYLDGQLSFMKAEQNTYFSYSTGNVDTLIAVQQADQSVLVTPVYQVSSREISSQFSYGGLTLSGTYYFWSTAKRRFNFTATAGIQYLLSSQVEEKIKGNWIPRSTESTDKLNYSFMVGAGYNVVLKGGWEVMINPALTYYLRQPSNNELPFNLNQGMLGLNIMVSKSLGGKQ